MVFGAIVTIAAPATAADPGANDRQGLLHLRAASTQIDIPVSFAARLEGVGEYALDRFGTRRELEPATDMHLRLGLRARRALGPWTLLAEYEQDVVTGTLSGKPSIEGEQLPDSRAIAHPVRKAYGRLSLGPLVHIAGGLMTSHWGLGLIANDGAHDWAPGEATFGDGRGGDRVLRLLLASGPLTDLGLIVAAAFDWVQEDESLFDDSARQVVGSLSLGAGGPHSVGVYGVYRRQRAADGDRLDAVVFDFAASTRVSLANDLSLRLAAEAALITGDTTLGSSTTAPKKSVRQFGAALRASLDRSRYGFVFDLLFASGDGNYDDDGQNNFRADPNYELSLLLYRQVLASHTGRGVATAADPNLVGQPADDLDRFPTQGGISNTVALFPRLYGRPFAGLEVYGGPLFAFAASDTADPLNSRAAGGVPRNALDGQPGNYLGTELDLGARYRHAFGPTELTVGIEAGWLMPGSALRQADGTSMDDVLGGRLLLQYRL